MDDCARFCAWVAPYVDGELDADHAVEMEGHVVGCATCTERIALIRAVRASVKRTSMRQAPAQLCARMHAVVAAEARSQASHSADAARSARHLLPLRYAVGLAAAAGVLFAMGVSRYTQPRYARNVDLVGRGATESDVAAATNIDGVLEELIALHARPFPPDTTDPDQLSRFDPLLGVQFHRPPFKPFGASFSGARVHPVSDRGALLQVQYTVADGKRFTMYVFNPRVLPVQTTRLERRVIRQRPMLVGQLGGYSVAALEQSGIGYAYASDLDTDESAKIMAAAITQ